MKIAITGGMGFIGRKLALQMLGKGHGVVLIDSLTPQIHGDVPEVSVPEGGSFFRMDVRELSERSEVLEGCDVVYHLAAETGTGQSMYQIAQYTSVNDGGTAALLEALTRLKARPRKLVLASSRSVYGEGAYMDSRHPGVLFQPWSRSAAQLAADKWECEGADGAVLTPIATHESTPMQPGSVYAATKGAQELLVTSAAPSLGMQAVVFRFQNVYGEGQSLRNPYTGIISIFYNRARQGIDIPVYEDGLESRDFVHVDDVVAALVASSEAELPHGVVMNVGAGKPTSVSELVRTLLDVAGFEVPVKVTGQYRVGDIRHCWADVSRLESHLSLKPSVSLKDGLDRFCQWARTQPAYMDRSEVATQELRQKGLAR